MNVKILSLVGKQPLAIVSPIVSFLDQFHKNDNTDIDIHFLATDETLPIGERCLKWLKAHYGVRVAHVALYPSREMSQVIQDVSGGETPVCFNTNPGMTWQIAQACLHLPPDNTICLFADAFNLYVWRLAEDTATAQRKPLLNIGLAAHLELTGRLKVAVADGISKTISAPIRKFLREKNLGKLFSLSFPGDVPEYQGISKLLLDEINDRLVWIEEFRGRIFLLFDLLGKARFRFPHARFSSQQAYLMELFRVITALFDSINYGVTIITDKDNLVTRAGIEGVDYILIDPTGNWKNELSQWVRGHPKVKAARSLPVGIKTLNEIQSLKSSSAGAPLATCMGNNIETTLKAILSHPGGPVFLCYDGRTERITHFARQTKRRFHQKDIRLIETDHRGAGLQQKLLSIDGLLPYFNITPGTKMQTVALTMAARILNRTELVVSIDKGDIRGLLDNKTIRPVVAPGINDIIAVHLADEDSKNRVETDNPFWKDLLNVIAGRQDVETNSEMMKIRIKKHGHMTGLLKAGDEPGVIICPLLKKSYQVPPKIIKGGGFWWEAVVADAFHRHLKAEVYWQLAWKSPEGKDGRPSDRLTEIDVAAAFGNHKLMVSCKAGRSYSMDWEVFAIKSEAVHRFGRFTLPFLAVPYETGQKDRLRPGRIIGGVMILTPSILVDREKLIAHINLLAEHLQTTKNEIGGAQERILQ